MIEKRVAHVSLLVHWLALWFCYSHVAGSNPVRTVCTMRTSEKWHLQIDVFYAGNILYYLTLTKCI